MDIITLVVAILITLLLISTVLIYIQTLRAKSRIIAECSQANPVIHCYAFKYQPKFLKYRPTVLTVTDDMISVNLDGTTVIQNKPNELTLKSGTNFGVTVLSSPQSTIHIIPYKPLLWYLHAYRLSSVIFVIPATNAIKNALTNRGVLQ